MLEEFEADTFLTNIEIEEDTLQLPPIQKNSDGIFLYQEKEQFFIHKLNPRKFMHGSLESSPSRL